VTVTLTCNDRATAGRGAIQIGHTSLGLACKPAASVAVGNPELTGEPSIVPWAVRLTVRNSRDSTTTCAARGTGLPGRLACHAIGNPEDFVEIVLQLAPEPD
jgi:hypothetical protein